MLFEEAKAKMNKTVSSLEEDYKTLRTGRASTAIFDKIKIDQYGQQMPLNQVAALTTPDPRSIVIKPWDKSSLPLIEKAILAANIGLVPANDGKIIRITVPPLSRERRSEIVKQAKQRAEEHRVSIRNIRRQANETLHAQQKASEISEDEARRSMDKVDKETESHIASIDATFAKKEKEIMEE